MSTSPTVIDRDLPTGTWWLDPDQTTITVTARKLGVFNIPATLAVTSGTIEIDADSRVTGVQATADANSYTSPMAKRNDHIRSADFLDADNHPELSFNADTVVRTATGYQADGTVTVKGQTSPISVDVSAVDIAADRASFVATAVLDRHVLGVDKFPSFVIGPRVRLTVTATALLATN